MKEVIEIAKIIYMFLMSIGVDIVVVICIVAITQACKKKFKWTSKTSFIIILSTGTTCGILKIVSGQVELGQYMTALFGYPGISVLLYMGMKIFLPKLKEKFFPSSNELNEK